MQLALFVKRVELTKCLFEGGEGGGREGEALVPGGVECGLTDVCLEDGI